MAPAAANPANAEPPMVPVPTVRFAHQSASAGQFATAAATVPLEGKASLVRLSALRASSVKETVTLMRLPRSAAARV